MLYYSTQVAHGDMQAKLRPELIARVIPADASGNRSGGIVNALGEWKWNRDFTTFELKGQCSAYGNSPTDPKPWGMAVDATRPYSCLLREGYAEAGTDGLLFSAGKRTLDFSDALLTSPVNPSKSGLTSPTPLSPQEGVLVAQAKALFGSRYSLTGGVALDPDDKFRAHPYARLKGTFDPVDVSLTGAERFAGMGVTSQVTPTIMLYAEANAHVPTGAARVHSDALFGANWSPAAAAYSFSAEYFRHGEANAGFTTPRRDVYGFPAPTSEAPAAWGPSDFLGRDYLFVHVMRSSDELSGPIATALVNLGDGGMMTNLGYRLVVGKTPAWVATAEWKSFQGPGGSEFARAARYQGRNLFSLTLTVRE